MPQSGRRIYLDDVAKITEAFDPDQPTVRWRGKPALDLVVHRQWVQHQHFERRTIAEWIGRGREVFGAIVDQTCERLLAVILTSVTMIGGLTSLLLETRLQARFLTPMAVTLVFGLAPTTFLVLYVVPSIIGMQGGFRRPIALRNRGPKLRNLP